MVNLLKRILFGPDGGAAIAAAASGSFATLGTDLVSPYQGDSLAHIAWSEHFTGATDVVDRNAAMRVAPIKRGRAIIVGSIADLPLVALNGEKAIQRQPRWLTRSNTIVSPWHRMSTTLDDLIFHGWSLWATERGVDGDILDALRISPSRWSFDKNSPLGIKVDGNNVTDPKSVILFAGPDEGLLATGADVIRGSRAMEQAWVGRVQNPIPMTVLHEVERNGVSQEEAQQYVAAWSAARTSPNGAVGFLPAQLNMEVYGETEADLFIQGRNALRLDVANLLNLPASVLDGSTATASLTYQTAQGEFSQLNAWLEYWMAPIEARLSQNDVSPNGQVIRFARGNLSVLTEHGAEPLPGGDEPATPVLPALEAAA